MKTSLWVMSFLLAFSSATFGLDETLVIRLLRSKNWDDIKMGVSGIQREIEKNPSFTPSLELIQKLQLVARTKITDYDFDDPRYPTVSSAANALAKLAKNSQPIVDFFLEEKSRQNWILQLEVEELYKNLNPQFSQAVLKKVSRFKKPETISKIAVFLNQNQDPQVKKVAQDLFQAYARKIQLPDLTPELVNMPDKWKDYETTLLDFVTHDNLAEASDPSVTQKIENYLKQIKLKNMLPSDYQEVVLPLIEILLYTSDHKPDSINLLKNLAKQAADQNFKAFQEGIELGIQFAETGNRNTTYHENDKLILDRALKVAKKAAAITKKNYFAKQTKWPIETNSLISAIIRMKSQEDRTQYLKKLIPHLLAVKRKTYNEAAEEIVYRLLVDRGDTEPGTKITPEELARRLSLQRAVFASMVCTDILKKLAKEKRIHIPTEWKYW